MILIRLVFCRPHLHNRHLHDRHLHDWHLHGRHLYRPHSSRSCAPGRKKALQENQQHSEKRKNYLREVDGKPAEEEKFSRIPWSCFRFNLKDLKGIVDAFDVHFPNLPGYQTFGVLTPQGGPWRCASARIRLKDRHEALNVDITTLQNMATWQSSGKSWDFGSLHPIENHQGLIRTEMTNWIFVLDPKMAVWDKQLKPWSRSDRWDFPRVDRMATP